MIVWRVIVFCNRLELDTGFGEDGAVVVRFGAVRCFVCMYIHVWAIKHFVFQDKNFCNDEGQECQS